MFLSFIATVLCIFIVVWMLLGKPKTSIEEMNHLLSLDEDHLLDQQPTFDSEAPGALYDFSTMGKYVQCRYTDRYENEEHVEIVEILVLSTKAHLRVVFKDDALMHFAFKGCPLSVPEIYFEKRYLGLMDGVNKFLALHAQAIAQRLVAKRFREAQLM